jgi:hypothetical protein
MIVVVPTGGLTGALTATTGTTVLTSPTSFTYTTTAARPSLATSPFSVTSGGAGTALVISGLNLAGTTSVTLTTGSVAVPFVVLSTGRILVKIPSLTSALTSTFTISAASGTPLVSPSFTVTTALVVPGAVTFTPASATIGSLVTVTGTNIGAATSVSVGGVAVTSFTSTSANTLTFILESATSGQISVTTAGGTATSVASLVAF